MCFLHILHKSMLCGPKFYYFYNLQGAVGPVKSQGNCASCYALVAAQTIETSQFLKVITPRSKKLNESY